MSTRNFGICRRAGTSNKMEAKKLYSKLEEDFITTSMSDVWFDFMQKDPVAEYLSENFKNRSMGLVCDFADNIDKVYTAVFPTKEVYKKLLMTGPRTQCCLSITQVFGT